jgi:multiple sugar transport system permease protein
MATTNIAGQRRQEVIAGYGFIAPALFILAVFLFIPMFFTLWMSFRDWSGITPPAVSSPVGFEWYSRLLLEDNIRRSEFFLAFKNTFYYALGVVPAQTILALLLAITANQALLKFKGFFRTTFYFPSITSSVAIGLIFLWIYQTGGILNQTIKAIFPNYQNISWMNDPRGIFHNFLGLFGLTIRTAPSWLTEPEILGLTPWQWVSGPSVTMSALMMLVVWTTAGTMMLVFLAALQDIPRPLYEAASVDGATGWDQFWSITVPMLRPTIFFVVTLGLIGTFQVFDQMYVMTSGGPAGTTTSLAYLIYRAGFNDSQMGLASAISVLLFLIIFLATVIQRRIFSDRAAN